MGTAERLRNLRNIIPANEPVIVVLSAMSGVTNALAETITLACEGKEKLAIDKLKSVEKHHEDTCNELFAHSQFKQKALSMVNSVFEIAFLKVEKNYQKSEKEILAIGEILSTNLFQTYLEEVGEKSILLHALDFMKTDQDGEPDYQHVSSKLAKLISFYPGTNLFVTQGYISRNNAGDVDNLKRGGSDYTAAIIGNAIDASEVQIWTDIDGFRNNDPRFVSGTIPVREQSFDEAA